MADPFSGCLLSSASLNFFFFFFWYFRAISQQVLQWNQWFFLVWRIKGNRWIYMHKSKTNIILSNWWIFHRYSTKEIKFFIQFENLIALYQLWQISIFNIVNHHFLFHDIYIYTGRETFDQFQYLIIWFITFFGVNKNVFKIANFRLTFNATIQAN